MHCSVCSGPTEHFDTALVLGRYEGLFLRCLSCGFIFASNPYWLEEAYSTAISATDQGLVSRNIWFSNIVRSIVCFLFDSEGKFLDYGGGTGLFTRLMRDAGYDWFWFDRHCQNVFAQGFSADIECGSKYELLSAAELFEHLTEPVPTVSKLCSLSDNILFTTRLLPHKPPKLDKWWYYSLEHGQHVSFYSKKSLQILAETCRLNLTTNGSNLHLFSRRSIPDYILKLAANDIISRIVALTNRRKSLLLSDYEQARQYKRSENANRP